MQTVSEKYKSIIEGAGYFTESKLIISGNTYGIETIKEMSTSSGTLDDNSVGVGNCISRSINVILHLSPDNVPKMAELCPYVRVIDSSHSSEWTPLMDETTFTSEWIQKGVFYVDTREYNKYSQLLTLKGYDSILKLEQDYILSEQSWSDITDITAVNYIANRYGLTVDSRTTPIISNGYKVGFPGMGDAALTCREVLGYVGSMYCGNWITNDKGELQLIQLFGIPTESYLLIDNYGNYVTFGGDRINAR